MGITTKFKEMFSSASTTISGIGHRQNRKDVAGNMFPGGVGAAVAVSSDLGNFLTGMSNFPEMPEQQIYEQFYIWEPEIAATINKTSAMVRSSFNYFTLIDDAQLDNLPTTDKLSTIEQTDDVELFDDLYDISSGINTPEKALRQEMVDVANQIARQINIPNMFEVYASIMYMHGEVFLRKHPDKSLEILPNDRVTVLDNLERIRNVGAINPSILITQENFLIIDEYLQTQQVINKNEFIHIKLYDVPLNLRDLRGRPTYGIYSISPLQRCIVPVWLKRQVYITETLWRWANVPREHHTIEAEAYKLNLYPGTPEMKKQAAEKAMSADIAKWSAKLKVDAPDQKYVTSSNIKINSIEHDASSYMESNGLLEQVNEAIWDGVGMPKSVIKGKSDGSYASELIVASGASMFIEQISNKIARVILENMKERLLIINKQYPVDHLDINIKFKIAQNRLEQMRDMQLMTAVGQFTSAEIREEIGKSPLTDDQINNEGVVTAGNIRIIKGKTEFDKQGGPDDPINKLNTNDGGLRPTNGGVDGGKGDGTSNNPTTAHSGNKQGTDSSKAVGDTVLYKGND